MKNILFLFFVCLAYGSFCQNTDSTDARGWSYEKITKNFSGEIVDFEAALQPCGTVAYASICIVKKEDGKLIRVLTLCNTKTNYKKGDEVIIAPQEKPKMYVNASPAKDTFDHIKSTVFGSITKFE